MRTHLLAIVLVLAISAHAGADHCETYSASYPEVEVPATAFAALYVDYDHCPHEGCVTSVWVYEESNGLPGLQRGDETVNDTCHGAVAADRLVL